ncbi:hypothetical protein scyTo_0021359, partial [Scyliorhinus torazame]|nr:hypothetical protein [Scyliorhinus torazame]
NGAGRFQGEGAASNGMSMPGSGRGFDKQQIGTAQI